MHYSRTPKTICVQFAARNTVADICVRFSRLQDFPEMGQATADVNQRLAGYRYPNG